MMLNPLSRREMPPRSMEIMTHMENLQISNPGLRKRQGRRIKGPTVSIYPLSKGQLPKFLREVDEKEFPLDELKCGICNDYIIDARISQCTHQFCWLCFETHLLKNPLCPICRLNFKLLRISPCLDIDKVIEKFFANSKVFQLRKSIVDTTRVIKR